MTAADDAIRYAQQQLGSPYVWGADSPRAGFDCSGLMEYVWGLAGIKLPRTAAEQQAFTTPVQNPAAGDLVFYGAPAYHVGLYIGGGKMIDAPDSGDVVKIQNVWGSPAGYGRVPGAGTAIAPVVGLATAGLSTVADAASSATSWLGGARAIVMEGVFLALGLGLIGYGAYRSASPAIKREIGSLT